ncbi:MAG TPA: thiamine-phosphate kinase [Gaiellaceae bacterium]|nr:thiamine-phosphate kinase [Gaiellaceae bacterium]
MTRLSQIGEVALLRDLEARGLIRDVENDAAVVGNLVVTQDALVENLHFRFDWIDWRELGFRVAAVNLSDLAASGADPVGLVVTLAAPGSAKVADVVALYEGIAEAGVPVVGGDTTAAPLVVISVSALGRSERVPGRSGARPGDVLVVTGPLGAAGAAFRERRYVRPPVRVAEGRALARHAHAMLDISDGIAVDAGHIAYRSGVRCIVELDRIPLAPGANIDHLGFGEDFELLAAVADPAGYPVVGRVEEGSGVELLLNGEPFVLSGWEHYK